MAGQPGLFDWDRRYAALSAAGDPLERLALVIDFELFRAELDAALDRSDRAKGGRPPYDAVLMFKVHVLRSHGDPGHSPCRTGLRIYKALANVKSESTVGHFETPMALSGLR